MDAIRAVFLLFLIGFGLIYGNALTQLLDTSWLLFAVVAIGFPLGLAWLVGDEEDRADFYKIKDWFKARLGLAKNIPLQPPERPSSDD